MYSYYVHEKRPEMRQGCFLLVTIVLRLLWAASLWNVCSSFGPCAVHIVTYQYQSTGMGADTVTHNRPPRSTRYLSSVSENAESTPNDCNGDSIGSGNKEDQDRQVPSTPCTRICRYNANFYDGQVCIGCYRDTYEISAWDGMSAMDKSFACLDAADRIPHPAAGAGDGGGDDDTGKEYDESRHGFGGAISRQELEKQARYWEKIASG